METPCPADAMNDGRPSAEPVSEHGTEPTLPLDGQGTTPSDDRETMVPLGQKYLQMPRDQALVLLAQANATQAQTIDALVLQVQELTDRLLEAPDEGDEADEAHGVDMAGKPIRTS